MATAKSLGANAVPGSAGAPTAVSSRHLRKAVSQCALPLGIPIALGLTAPSPRIAKEAARKVRRPRTMALWAARASREGITTPKR